MRGHSKCIRHSNLGKAAEMIDSAYTCIIRYIRSNIPLDELELRARYPPVDRLGREKKRGDAQGIAAAWGE